MTDSDKQLLRYRKIMDDVGLDFFILNSTLLSVYRDKQFYLSAPEGGPIFGIMKKDLTDEVLDELRKRIVVNRNGEHQDFDSGSWYLGGQCHIYAFSRYKNRVVMKMNLKCGWWWIADDLFPYKKITYLGIEWNIPNSPAGWLSTRYNINWKTPMFWDWHDSLNTFDYSKLEDLC